MVGKSAFRHEGSGENWRARGHLVNRIGGEKIFNSLWQLDLGENAKITKIDIF